MSLSPNVVNNVLEFLKRVEMKGLEAFAFTEAYTAVNAELSVKPEGAAGVPFVPPAVPPVKPSDAALVTRGKRRR